MRGKLDFWQPAGKNPLLRIASPPGIGAFVANSEYAHGGISLQECVVPELIVERGEEAVTATITEISRRGMRCRVTVKSNEKRFRRVSTSNNDSRTESKAHD